MKYLISLIALVFSSSLFAAGLELSWAPPTKRIDGTEFTVADIDHYTAYYSCPAGSGGFDTDSTTTTYVMGVPDPGVTCTYWLTVTDKSGQTSDKSEVISITGEEPLPAKPKAPYWTRQVITHLDNTLGPNKPYWAKQLVWNLEAQFDGVRGL